MYTADELEIRCALAGSPRAEQLIACLEGEIAKRDEELAACRVAVENCEVFRARIVELEAYRDSHQRCAIQAMAELAAIKAQGVVMPEPMKRGDEGGSGEYGAAMIRGYNACLREVARLNAAPAAPAADAPPENCRQRLAAEGKPYPRSSCAVCGKFSPKLRECDAALAAHRAQGVV